MKTTEPNKRERKAAQLLNYYAACEALGRALGMTNPDGKRISVALLNLERLANAGATASCNGERFQCRFHVSAKQAASMPWEFDFNRDENAWDSFAEKVQDEVRFIFGAVPTSFFVNGDARGYALKIDNETPEGKALIEACKLHTDWGGYGILSPEITGE